MHIRKLTIKDKTQLDKLIDEIEATMSNPDYFLPITNVSRSHFFDEKWTYFLGAFDNDILVGAIALFYNENEFGESRKAIGISGENLAELGRAMTKIEYRGKGIMSSLCSTILEYASSNHDISTIICTIHPNNLPSQRAVKKFGFIKKGFITKDNKFKRDILIKDLLNEEKEH